MKFHSSNEAPVRHPADSWQSSFCDMAIEWVFGDITKGERVGKPDNCRNWNVWPFVVWFFQLWTLNTIIIPLYFVTINHKFGQSLGTYEAPSRLIECLTRIRRYPDQKKTSCFFLRNHPHVHHACGQRNAKHMANKHSRLFGQKNEVINHSTTNHSWPMIHPFVVYTLPNHIQPITPAPLKLRNDAGLLPWTVMTLSLEGFHLLISGFCHYFPRNRNPWRIHGAGILMLTWLGYIDGECYHFFSIHGLGNTGNTAASEKKTREHGEQFPTRNKISMFFSPKKKSWIFNGL